jgi:hypothetical protein
VTLKIIIYNKSNIYLKAISFYKRYPTETLALLGVVTEMSDKIANPFTDSRPPSIALKNVLG